MKHLKYSLYVRLHKDLGFATDPSFVACIIWYVSQIKQPAYAFLLEHFRDASHLLFLALFLPSRVQSP